MTTSTHSHKAWTDKGGHVIFTLGAGRSGLISRCFAMRLMHCGKPSYAAGDCGTPRPKEGDLGITISSSGETPSLVAIGKRLIETGAEMVLISARTNSTLSKICHKKIILECCENHNIKSILPMGSLFEHSAYLFLDCTIAAIINATGLTHQYMQNNHTILE